MRALAVWLVILFHYRVPGFEGGFVGVDIFFVISGFLITGIIEGELEGGRFSFLRFYERRVRRILPALFVVLAAAAVVASLLLFPNDYLRFARSALAAALFWSNIHFWNTAGYWGVAASQKPLLHTWSLAVEEQFYLVFPAILFVMHGRRWRLIAVAGILVASFAGSVWAVGAARDAAFYLSPFRFWELMAGAVLTLTMSDIDFLAYHESSILRRLGTFVRTGRPILNLPTLISLAGLAMIAVSVTTLRRGAPFPGTAAILPVLGTVLLIWAGPAPQNAVSRLLSLRPIVFMGLISYSLYLWHWPIYVFLHYYLYGNLSWGEVVGCMVLSVALASLSWRFIEQPFRRHLRPVPRRPLFAAAAVATLAVCVFAGVVLHSRGMRDRFSPAVRRILFEAHDTDGLLAHCFALPPKEVTAKRLCRIGASQKIQPSFILWGDSHADAILPAVEGIARKEGREGFFAGASSCAPLVGVYRFSAPQCRAFNDHVLAFVKAHPEIKVVILMARWGKNAQGTAYGDEGHGFVPIADSEGRAHKPSDNAAIFTRGLKRTVNALRAAHRKVVLVGPVPEIGWPVPLVLARMKLAGKKAVMAPPEKAFFKREKVVLPLFHKLAERKGVKAVFPNRYMCASGRCAVRKKGIPLYRDEHHLSVYGARKLEPLLTKVIGPVFANIS